APLWRVEQDVAALVPADPMMTQPKADTRLVEPPQPRAQQRRGLERLGEHAAARSDERVLAEPLAPGAHGGRRKRLDRGAQMRQCRAVAREKPRQLLAVSKVEPSPPRQQKLPRD